MNEEDILRIYWQNDDVEKAFIHSKPYMEALYYRFEIGRRTKMFLSTHGYPVMTMIASRFGFTYQQTEKIISCIKDVVQTKGSHFDVEPTKESKELMEKISIEL